MASPKPCRFVLLLLLPLALGCARDAETARPVLESETLESARALVDMGDIEASARLFEVHADSMEKAGYPAAALSARNEWAIALQGQGRWEEALRVFSDAIARYTASPENARRDTTLAIAFHKMGVSYYFLDQYDQAIAHLEKALDIRRKVLPPNHPDIVNGYHSIGDALQLDGRYEEAIRYLKTSLSLQPDSATNVLPFTYRVLGNVYDEIGDYFQGIKYLLLARDLFRQRFHQRPYMLAGLENDLAIVFRHAGELDSAIQHGRQATAIILSLGLPDAEDSLTLANYYNTLGAAYEANDELAPAREYYEKALALHTGASADNLARESMNLNNLGIVYRRLGHFELAENALRRAIAINLEQGEARRLAGNYHNLGEVFFDAGRLNEALRFQHLAMRQLAPDFEPEPEGQGVPAIQELAGQELLFLDYGAALAKALLHRYRQTGQADDLAHAQSACDSLALMIDRLRFSYLADDSKINLATTTRPVFETGIQICLARYQVTGEQNYLHKAFDYSEKSKALALLEAIKDAKAKNFGLPEHALRREKALKQEIARLENQLQEEKWRARPDRARLEKLQSDLLRLQRDMETVVETLEREYPDYFRLKYQIKTTGVADLRRDTQLLAPDQTLLSYFLGNDYLYVFTISGRHFQMDTIALDFPLRAWVDQMRQGISDFARGGDAALALYRESAQSLYNKLIAPVAGVLSKQLILVPDDVLGLLPFEALLSALPPEAESRRFHAYPYLIKDRQISYSYSATLLAETRHMAPSSTCASSVLAFAPMFLRDDYRYSDQPLANRGGVGGLSTSGLSPLYFNEAEARALRQFARVRIVNGERARKARFSDLAPKYRFIHIATHGVADNEQPDYSFIAFAQPADTLMIEELLFARELYNLSLCAEMVVLSACETGIGKIRKGEGIVSLARGFSYAGARSIVTTLWRISDQQSQALIEGFYRRLSEGRSKDEALRQAKLDYVNRESPLAHPYYWAGFIPIGDMKAVRFTPPGLTPAQWLLLIGGAALVLLALGLNRSRWRPAARKR
jgi:CHAT domain-containing protein/Tfp pilus assembly protein PilF